MKPVETMMRTASVIPVLVIEDVAHARPIAEALVAGGLPVLEVTLRTAAALDVIAEMKKVPGAIVGAGTIVDIPGLESAIAAGAVAVHGVEQLTVNTAGLDCGCACWRKNEQPHRCA